MGANPNSHTVRQSFPTDEGVVTTPKIGIIIRKSANRWARNVFFSTDCDFFRMKMCGNKKYVYICSPKTKVLIPGGRGIESFSRDLKRRDAGVVDRAALEMRCTGNCTGGSNPSLSAANSTIYIDVNRAVSFLQKSPRKQGGNRHDRFRSTGPDECRRPLPAGTNEGRHARNSRKTRAEKTVNVLNETVYPDPHVCAIVGFLVICDRINSFRTPDSPINR